MFLSAELLWTLKRILSQEEDLKSKEILLTRFSHRDILRHSRTSRLTLKRKKIHSHPLSLAVTSDTKSDREVSKREGAESLHEYLIG